VSLSPEDLAYIGGLVRERSAIVLNDTKAYLVESRLTPLVRAAGLIDLHQLVRKLQQTPRSPLHDQVVEAMTTNETSFFRDIHPFEALKRDVVPALIEKRKAVRTLSIWCAAASSGQEPYSIAMSIADGFPELAGWKVRIVATDLATSVLERAKQGRYSQLEVNRGLPAAMLSKHFERDGTDWRVSAKLRSMIEFRPLNLIAPWPAFPSLDIVFIRNVMIYFDLPTKRDILRRTAKLMHSDGVLFLGSAETTLNVAVEFERVQSGKASWYKLKERSS